MKSKHKKRKRTIKKQPKSSRRRTSLKHRSNKRKYDGTKNTDYDKKIYELFNRNLIEKSFLIIQN